VDLQLASSSKCVVQPPETATPQAASGEGIALAPYLERLEQMTTTVFSGRVAEVVGLTVESSGPPVALGDVCELRLSGGRKVRSSVIGFRGGRVISMPLEEMQGIQLGDRIVARNDARSLRVGPDLLGRVLDGFGEPMDGGDPLRGTELYDLHAVPPDALDREHISEPLVTGIRAIDAFLPCGKGQRMGFFGGSGVGKSTLLGAITRYNHSDVTVIALVGERNREVRAFLEQEMGPEARKRSVVVVATSDRPAPLRVRACFVALAVAEYFRDQGKSVLLVMDSVTRLAMAQREIGLAAGEPPSQKGYTPSVFALLPKIFERAGNFKRGSITGFFTVLVEGDDFNEPICDACRAILDGHVVLSRKLGNAGHYPAIDILSSVSRLSTRVASKAHQTDAQKLRQALAVYQNSEDLIRLGAYVAGSDARLDSSVKLHDRLLSFLQQKQEDSAPIEATLKSLSELASALA
jgi:flagellum-specific ATP synthase